MIYKMLNGWEIRVYEADQRDYSSMKIDFMKIKKISYQHYIHQYILKNEFSENFINKELLEFLYKLLRHNKNKQAIKLYWERF